jgi:hypothetical protein
MLPQDAFGNYVVQYVLELGQSEASQAIITQLNGHFAELSMQKFSSNVVERCLKLGGVVGDKGCLMGVHLSQITTWLHRTPGSKTFYCILFPSHC